MTIINVLFLSLSREEDEFRQDLEDALKHIRSLSKLALEEAHSLEEVTKDKLADFDIFLLWVGRENPNAWWKFADFMDEHSQLDHVGFIVIFGFRENVQEKARDAMLRGIYAFACPFNFHVFEAYIEATALEAKHHKSLLDLEDMLFRADDLDTIATIALDQLKSHPLVGYDRASISLVDQNTGQRYLLKHDPALPNPDRRLLKLIDKDKLIENVIEKTVLAITDLKDLRANNQEELTNFGWSDTDATVDINSWVGLAVTHQDQSVAIITLDHKTPGHYARYGDKLTRFLKDFGGILADVIEDLLQGRNARVVREITSEIGDDLKSEALMLQILVKLRYELKCDNCTYFTVSSLVDVKEPFLDEWVTANDPNNPDEQQKRAKRSFKKGVGIVGAVLADGQSRIVPHALESEEFEPTFQFSGSSLSMLAVPVIPYVDSNEPNQPSRIIGVISCHKRKKDHFTVYDRDLVEAIAQSTATVIERTMALEYSTDISRKMNDLVLNPDKANLLRKICEHALKVTSARAAVIHRLKWHNTLPEGEEEYRLTGEYYTFPEGIEPPAPRMDGKGTTDVVIREKQTKEFSKKFGNFDCISEELRNRGVNYQIVVPLMIRDEAQNQQHLIGTLYLNKYSEDPFSEVEKFALELFASQAASTIYHQEFLSERLTWTKANTDLAKAVEVIASTDHPDLLLKDIAYYAYSLVGASFSYLALLTDGYKFEFRAAWPEYILAELAKFHSKEENFKKENGSSENGNKKGITGLAAERGETILIGDLQEEKKKNSEYWQEYIEFRKGTRSELSIPIKENTSDSSSKVIGVINLEHEKPYAFTEVHREVIEHFARQVAIAFQKKSLVESVRSKNNILTGLQRSLQKIIESSPQNMLHDAVSLTREAVESQEVIVIPIRRQTWKLEVLAKEIVPYINSNHQFLISILERLSLDVYDKQKPLFCSDLKSLARTVRTSNANQAKNSGLVASSGLCIPFSSRDQKMGVMWILFSKSFGQEPSDEDIAIYQVYANQIALAYNNAKQSEELKLKLAKSTSDLTVNIDQNYKDARKQANLSFAISICTSIAGLILIFYGVSNLINKPSQSPRALTGGSELAAIIGVLLQGVTVLAFDRGKAANERMDRYHRELYNVRQLHILLSATEQLNSEAMPQVKQQIIERMTNSWIQSVNENKNSENKKAEKQK